MTDIDIHHLCDLAALDLSAAESEAVAEDLRRIIAMVDQMQTIDTDGVEPLAHPLDSQASLRADEVTEEVDRDRYQASAPETDAGFYLVPKVVE
jgi:aspartyl-tRNA(Asn)/glutamyl-tRNA(Gln) amidotransferase subunit C